MSSYQPLFLCFDDLGNGADAFCRAKLSETTPGMPVPVPTPAEGCDCCRDNNGGDVEVLGP